MASRNDSERRRRTEPLSSLTSPWPEFVSSGATDKSTP